MWFSDIFWCLRTGSVEKFRLWCTSGEMTRWKSRSFASSFSPVGRFGSEQRSSPFTVTTSPKSSSTQRGEAVEGPQSSLSPALSPSPLHPSPLRPQPAAVVAQVNQPTLRLTFKRIHDNANEISRRVILLSPSGPERESESQGSEHCRERACPFPGLVVLSV